MRDLSSFEHHTYTKAQLEDTIEDLTWRVEEDRAVVEDSFLTLIDQHVPIEEAKECCLQEFTRTYPPGHESFNTHV